MCGRGLIDKNKVRTSSRICKKINTTLQYIGQLSYSELKYQTL